MNRYRISFDNYSTTEYLETGQIKDHVEYDADRASQALRKWHEEYWGLQADSIQKISDPLEDK